MRRVTVVGIVKLALQAIYFIGQAQQLEIYVDIYYCFCVENNLGIMTACMPAMKPLYNSCVSRVRGLKPSSDEEQPESWGKGMGINPSGFVSIGKKRTRPIRLTNLLSSKNATTHQCTITALPQPDRVDSGSSHSSQASPTKEEMSKL